MGLAFSFVCAARPLSPVTFAQVRSQSSRSARDNRIVKYETAQEDGSLLVTYDDGTIERIRKEHGRVRDGNLTLTQEAFSEIQIADDRLSIGWLADYVICAQSYACHIDMVILRRGRPVRYVKRSSPGVIWDWTFLNNGAQVAVESGFPHGDATGMYELFDTDSGQPRGTFVPDPDGEKPAPKWVEQFRSLRTRR
jgi:hypothetical protein